MSWQQWYEAHVPFRRNSEYIPQKAQIIQNMSQIPKMHQLTNSYVKSLKM